MSSPSTAQSRGVLRLAAIDLGTNTALLTIAELRENGELTPLLECSTVTRLGQGVDETGCLHPDAKARTLSCLGAYRRQLDAHQVEAVCAVGTSALRDAEGGPEFRLELTELIGTNFEIISGSREAELSFLGSKQGLELGLEPEQTLLVFDIGGGSTEFVLARRCSAAQDFELLWSRSLNVGSVRLTERVGLSDPPSQAELARIDEEIARALAELPALEFAPDCLLGVAGTVTTLVGLQALERGEPVAAPLENSRLTTSGERCSMPPQAELGSLESRTHHGASCHGKSLSLRELSHWARRLSLMSQGERRSLPGMTPGRADVIVAGARLCEAVVRWSCAGTSPAELDARSDSVRLLASDRGVRWGLLLEMAETIKKT